jgi:PAS domain S-box-containing protein
VIKVECGCVDSHDMEWVAVGIAVGLILALLRDRIVRRRELFEFRNLFEQAPVSMIILDADGLACANNRVASLLGVDPEDRKPDLDGYLAPESVGEVRNLFGRVSASLERIEIADTTLSGNNGETIHCDLVASPTRYNSRPAILIAFFPVDQKEAARDALRQSEERFRRFFSELPVPAYRTSLDGKIIDFNKALLDILELHDERALRGANAADFYVDPDDRRAEGRGSDGRLVADRILHLRAASGRDLRVRDMNRTVMDTDGPIFEGVVVDVTREQQYLEELEQREQQQESLAEIARTALRGNDVEEAMGEAVRRVGAVLGADCTVVTPRQDGLESLSTKIAFETDSVRMRETIHDYLLDSIKDDPDSEGVIDLPPGHGPGGCELNGVAAVLCGSDEVYGVIAAAGCGFLPGNRDRAFLATVAATLGSAIARRRDHDRMDQLMRSKDEFIASVSHELRTPLTVVAGLSFELEQKWQTFSDSELGEFIALISSESREMADLIEDLLVAARADIGKVPVYLEDIDLRSCIDQVVDACALADRARIQTSGDGVLGCVDPVRYRQVIRNLITNAIRYGGPRIWVTVGAVEDEAVVSVSDDGAGIAAADREKVFAAYERAHQSQHVPGSVGLGLTVSRKLTELMGGSISYRYEGGSNFELRFPLVRTALRVD